MVVVVSDTSPIRALAYLDRLDVLQSLFHQLVVPLAVEAELRHSPMHGTSVKVKDIPFVQVQAPANVSEVDRLRKTLDAGESKALAVDEELQAEVVLIDEAAGRAVAEGLGFLALGTCGVLVRAKQRGFVPELKPLLDDMIDNLGFFVSSSLRAQVLNAAGESS